MSAETSGVSGSARVARDDRVAATAADRAGCITTAPSRPSWSGEVTPIHNGKPRLPMVNFVYRTALSGPAIASPWLSP